MVFLPYVYGKLLPAISRLLESRCGIKWIGIYGKSDFHDKNKRYDIESLDSEIIHFQIIYKFFYLKLLFFNVTIWNNIIFIVIELQFAFNLKFLFSL